MRPLGIISFVQPGVIYNNEEANKIAKTMKKTGIQKWERVSRIFNVKLSLNVFKAF